MTTKSSVAAAIAACALISVAAIQPVNGAEPQLPNVVSADPANFTPNVNDGQVNSMVQIGNRVIAVGKFTTITEAASAGGTTYTRNGIFAFNATTGDVDTAFVPNVGTSEVNEVVDAGDGTVYLGGAFNSVNGAARTQRVARINATTGAVVATFLSPNLNRAITDMQLVGNRLFVGGSFTTVAGQPRTLLAALNATTGSDTGTVAVTFANTWNGGSITVKHFDISEDGATLVAVGNWRNVNGQSRPQIVKLDLTAQSATLSNWSTQRYATTCASAFDTYLRDVDISANGQYFGVVTTGAYAGGVGSGTLCDTVARWENNSQANANPTWVDYSGGDTLTQVKIVGSVMYVGGHQRWLNNPFAGDSAGAGAVSREGLAAVDVRNGLPFTWNPGRARGVGVWEFLTTSAGLWVGHDTNSTGGETRKRIALFPTAGIALPAENTGTLPTNAYLLGSQPGATDGVTRKFFTGTSVTSAATVAAGGVAWSQARGAFMIDGTLFTGWNDGTLRVRSFNGTTFGTSTNVNLNGLTAFANDLRNVTGMFYDRTTARLYYTISGQTRLYYRYFLPESRIVGAVRFDGPANGNGITWSQTAGLFLNGGTLYQATTAGNLSAVGWNSGSLTGNASTVSGPGTDGQNWNARGLFLYGP